MKYVIKGSRQEIEDRLNAYMELPMKVLSMDLVERLGSESIFVCIFVLDEEWILEGFK